MSDDTALSVVRQEAIQPWTPRLALTVAEALEYERQKQEFMTKLLVKGVHYDVIPGTGDKPALLKPGAEKILSSFGLNPRYRDTEPPVIDLSGQDHGGEAFIQFRKTCMVTRQVGTGKDDYVIVAEATANCSSWEKKYRWQAQRRKCPRCGAEAINRSKFKGPDGDLGWYCWTKKGGCDQKFVSNDPEITRQKEGSVPNPDIADLMNTIEKMADKRALVAACLLATGFSVEFTQDLEEVSRPRHVGPSDSDLTDVEYRQVEEPAPARQQRHQPAEAAPAAAPAPAQNFDGVAYSEEELAPLVQLSESLPKPWFAAKTRAMVAGMGFEAVMSKLVVEHEAQCGASCEHLSS